MREKAGAEEKQYDIYITFITCRTHNTLYSCVHTQRRIGKCKREAEKSGSLNVKNGGEMRAE